MYINYFITIWNKLNLFLQLYLQITTKIPCDMLANLPNRKSLHNNVSDTKADDSDTQSIEASVINPHIRLMWQSTTYLTSDVG